MVFFTLTLESVSLLKAVRDTPSSVGACVYEVSSNYLVQIKSYGPDKQIPYLTVDLDLGVRVMKAVRDTPSSNGACVYEVLSNYLVQIKSYDPDKQIPYLTFDLEL
jgi:hypothetical protein